MLEAYLKDETIVNYVLEIREKLSKQFRKIRRKTPKFYFRM